MATKRMMNTKIIDTDEFLKMPMSSRLLYYDFCMRADDDGIIDSPIRIMKSIGCTADDLQVLITKNYIIPFENGILVITHWLVHNTIRRDRYNPSIHIDERNQLIVVDKMYQKNNGKPTGNHLATNWQPSIGKNSSNNSNNIESINNKSIYEYIEEEFGKLLSPMEIEVINTWKSDVKIIKLAIKEASTSNQRSIKYIDKILYNWEQANLKSLDEVKRYCANFRKRKKGRGQLQKRSTDQYIEL